MYLLCFNLNCFGLGYVDVGILFYLFILNILQATATHKVQIDLTQMLHIPKCVKFFSTVNRPNLFYMVEIVYGFWLRILRAGHLIP